MKNYKKARKNLMFEINMSEKEWKMLKALLNPAEPAPSSILTVAEYIEKNAPQTETRISKKGVELIKVFYPTGSVKEYPVKHINSTTAFEH